MDGNAEGQSPDGPTEQDIAALGAAVRQIHAQIRLITAANFVGFMELSRSEQRDALLALLDSTTSTVEILDQFPAQNNPDQG